MRVLKLTSFKVAGLLCAFVMPVLAIAAADSPAAPKASSFSMLDSSDDSLMGWVMQHDAFSNPAEIQKQADRLSVEVLAKNIDSDAEFLIMMSDESAVWLALMDALAARVPEYAKSSAVTLARGSLRLKMAQIEPARTLLKPLLAQPSCESIEMAEEMAEICTPMVSAWLKTGKVQSIDLHSTLKVSAMADPRLPCAGVQDQSLALTLPLLSASLDKQTVARFAIRAAWPGLVAGCDDVADGVREAIEQAYPASELELAYAGALASVAIPSPRSLLLFGEDLPLPLQECDFAKAANCAVGKALGPLTAGRIAQRLQLLSSAFHYQGGQCHNTSQAEQERLETLAKAFETGVSAAVKLPLAQRAAALKSLLTEQFRPLGYKLNYALAMPVFELAKLDAAAALSVQHALIELLGTSASSDAWEKLAHLQLQAKQPQAALISLQQALRLDYSSQTARLEATLSAVLSGAEIAPPYQFDMGIARPWIFIPTQEMFELSDTEPLILAMLSPAQRKDRETLERWIQVLTLAAGLAGHEVELSFLEEEFSNPFSNSHEARTLKGRWFNDHIVLEGVDLPWPDQFASEPNAKAPRAISNAERIAIFKAAGIELYSGK